MTNNFDLFKQYIQKTYQTSGIDRFGTSFNKDEDTFFSIEIIRRGKDNPNMPSTNYLFKNYHINSLDDIDKYKQEFIDICDMFNMRAYVSICRKSYRKCLWKQNEIIAKRICDADYKKCYKSWQSAVSQYSSKYDKRWIIDIDDKDTDLDFVKNIINECQPIESNKIVTIFPTKSGYHMITLPFDKIEFCHKWFNKYGDTKNVPEIKKNSLTLLYENIRQE